MYLSANTFHMDDRLSSRLGRDAFIRLSFHTDTCARQVIHLRRGLLSLLLRKSGKSVSVQIRKRVSSDMRHSPSVHF